LNHEHTLLHRFGLSQIVVPTWVASWLGTRGVMSKMQKKNSKKPSPSRKAAGGVSQSDFDEVLGLI
jgi:hypothetical protein